MKDLLERLVRHIPAFLTTLLALIASPRRYALTRSSGTTADIEGALVFAILSAVLVFIMQVPLLSKETDVWTALASTLVVCLHGMFRTKETWRPMVRALSESGAHAIALNYPSSQRDLEAIADQVERVLADPPPNDRFRVFRTLQSTCSN